MDFLREINFPYNSVRKGQMEFLKQVDKTLREKGSILVSAPTGLGKTVSALAPALKIAKEKELTIVFLTSRQTQANQAIKTIHDISKKSGEKINYVAFIGKRHMCYHEERDLYPPQDFNDFCKKTKEFGKCEYYKNFKNEDFEDKQIAIIDESSDSFMSVEGFVRLAGSNKFCPYEMAAKKAYRCDVVICDYNYLFSSGIQENFLGRIGRSLEECVLIVDEGHNLPDRIRNSYSSVLSTETIRLAIKELGDHIKSPGYDSFIANLKGALEDLYFEHLLGEKKEFLIEPGVFEDAYMNRFSSLVVMTLPQIIDKLKEAEKLILEDKVVSFVGRIARFLQKLKEFDTENYIQILEKDIQKDKTILSLKLKCIDPSSIAGDVIDNSYGCVLMSGTLAPIQMYRDILGLGVNSKILELESPFEKENQMILVDDEVTSKYNLRGRDMYGKIGKRIQEYLKAGAGRNAIVFFPSYNFMEMVLEHVDLVGMNRKMFKEQRFMTKEKKEDYVEGFKETSFDGKSRVLFAVTSGSFAEGLDLPNEALELVIVVGLPLSVPDVTSDSIILHYDKKFRKGQLYGYIFPAMNKIVQAAGRCIRTEQDRGVIVLMDNRYLWPLYAQSFPKHWHMRCVKEIPEVISNFFN
ncbi:MAG: ATP-dependent DNA helicase [Nanoarchaeota archaeon]